MRRIKLWWNVLFPPKVVLGRVSEKTLARYLRDEQNRRIWFGW